MCTGTLTRICGGVYLLHFYAALCCTINRARAIITCITRTHALRAISVDSHNSSKLKGDNMGLNDLIELDAWDYSQAYVDRLSKEAEAEQEFLRPYSVIGKLTASLSIALDYAKASDIELYKEIIGRFEAIRKIRETKDGEDEQNN